MIQLPCEKPTLFKGPHFNHPLIIQAVRWYVTYKLSYRDVETEKELYEGGCQEKILPLIWLSGLFP